MKKKEKQGWCSETEITQKKNIFLPLWKNRGGAWFASCSRSVGQETRRKLVANNIGQGDFWLSTIFLSFLITALLSGLFFVIGESTVIGDGWSPVDRHKRLCLVFKKHKESITSFAYIKITWINEYREYYLFLLILENQWNSQLTLCIQRASTATSGINYLLCTHLMIMSLKRTPKAILCTGPLLFCFSEANVLYEVVRNNNNNNNSCLFV